MPRITPVLFTFPFPPQYQHFPSSVQVTGTFDDWQKTTAPLTKNDQKRRFEAEIQVDLERLPRIDDRDDDDANNNSNNESTLQKRKLVYKFILDGNNWLIDPTQPNERDYEGNLNNICFLKDRTLTEALDIERIEAQKKVKDAAEDEATIQKLSGGLSGTPNVAVNDPIQPSDLAAGNQHHHDHQNSSNSGGSGDDDGGGVGEMTHSTTTKTLVEPTTKEGSATVGDAKPLEDGSITTVPPAEHVSHSPSRSTTGDEHDGDGDYGVAILQGDPVTISPLQRTPSAEAAAGDAQPTVDASAATATTSAPAPAPAPAPASVPVPAAAENAPLSINTSTSNASASASARSLASSMSSHPTSSSNAQTPVSPTGSHSHKGAMPKLYGEEASKDNGTVKSAVPTTAISTTTPQFPSASSLAAQSSKAGGGVGGGVGGKKSIWKRLKKVFS
ncbi:hypothetical protein EC968_009194 [Mortierella alpina]|nr:hypothetical protein EC968_009194 [Mortierella alpina]